MDTHFVSSGEFPTVANRWMYYIVTLVPWLSRDSKSLKACVNLKNVFNHHFFFLTHQTDFRQSLKPFSPVQFGSVAQTRLNPWDPMNRSTPGLPVHHQLPEFTQTQVHQVGDAIQPSHPLLSPSPPAPNPSQHQGLFQQVNSSHEVAKVLEFQLQHQSFQWTLTTT